MKLGQLLKKLPYYLQPRYFCSSSLRKFVNFSNFFQVIGVISVFFIVVSIVSFCLKTHPDMRVPVIRNITVRTSYNTTAWTLDKYQTNAHQAFFFVECVCNAWFTIEILVRFVSCPNKFVFLRSR